MRCTQIDSGRAFCKSPISLANPVNADSLCLKQLKTCLFLLFLYLHVSDDAPQMNSTIDFQIMFAKVTESAHCW